MKKPLSSWVLLLGLVGGLWGCGGGSAEVSAGEGILPAALDGPAATTQSTGAATTAPSTAPKLSAKARARRKKQINKKLLALVEAGKYAECKPLLLELLRLNPNDNVAWYNLACVHSRLGELEQALECLNKALAKGYSDFRHMERDADLAALRRTPQYRRILARNEQIQRERAGKIRDALRRRFGPGYICQIDHANKLVFATNIDQRTLEELKTYLTSYAQAMWRELFTHRFEQYVTIVIPSPDAKINFPGQTRVGGFYAHAQRMLVAKQIGMVLTHEFTHALHDADQDGLGQRHAIWIMEGLATLFESSRVVSNRGETRLEPHRGCRVIPQHNRRLNLLKRFVAAGRTIPWKHFFNHTQLSFMNKAVVSYPQGRYIMMYLHQRGLLKKWYDAYTEGFAADRSGRVAMEKVFGKPLAKIEADWKRWVRRLKAPADADRRQPGRGSNRVSPRLETSYMGVRVRGRTDGLQIVHVVPGSGAQKAGLKAGDVIVNIDGERIIDSGAMIRLVSSHRVGDELKVRFRRDGQYRTAVVVLQPMPEKPPHAGPTTEPATRPAPKSRPRRRQPRKPQPPTTRPARKAA